MSNEQVSIPVRNLTKSYPVYACKRSMWQQDLRFEVEENSGEESTLGRKRCSSLQCSTQAIAAASSFSQTYPSPDTHLNRQQTPHVKIPLHHLFVLELPVVVATTGWPTACTIWQSSFTTFLPYIRDEKKESPKECSMPSADLLILSSYGLIASCWCCHHQFVYHLTQHNN